MSSRFFFRLPTELGGKTTFLLHLLWDADWPGQRDASHSRHTQTNEKPDTFTRPIAAAAAENAQEKPIEDRGAIIVTINNNYSLSVGPFFSRNGTCCLKKKEQTSLRKREPKKHASPPSSPSSFFFCAVAAPLLLLPFSIPMVSSFDFVSSSFLCYHVLLPPVRFSSSSSFLAPASSFFLLLCRQLYYYFCSLLLRRRSHLHFRNTSSIRPPPPKEECR